MPTNLLACLATTRFRRPGMLLVLLTLAAFPVQAPAWQTYTKPASSPGQSQSQTQSEPPATNPAPVRLASTPLRLRSLGLSIYLPEGSRSQTDIIGTTTATSIRPPGDAGLITIQSRSSGDPTITAKDIANGIISQLSTAKLIDRANNLTINDQPADRFYVELPPVGDRKSPTIHGYTVFVPTPDNVIIIELLAEPRNIAEARPLYETTVATAEFADPGDTATRRHAAIQAGLRFVESITDEDMRAVLEAVDGRWERLYTPAITSADEDATELGYRRLKGWVGKRGEIDPDQNPSRWSATDKQEGYLLRVDARLLNQGAVIDAQATYFLSFDGTQEAWSNRMAIRQGETVTNYTESGTRDKRSMLVAVQQGNNTPSTTKPVIQGEGYISALHSLLMGPLLARAGIATDYAFYAYQSQTESIRLRQDSVEYISGSKGPVKITTRLNEDARPQTAYYGSDGLPLRVEQPDGQLWAPTEPRRLMRLWSDKGLPVD